MDKINLTELQNQIDSRQLQKSKPIVQPQLNEDAMWDLWETMTKLFHHAWTSREGEEPTDIWGQLLTQLSQEQIDSGFDKLLDWKSDFPPTVLQFRQLCLPDTISPDGRGADAYLSFDDPRHSEYEHYQQTKRLRLEDSTTKSKRRKTGNAALKDLLGGL